MELNFYAPFAFPYSTDFSNLDGWTIVDADANTFTWTPGTIAGDTENGVLCYPMFMSAPKDYAYTPAISMPAGKSRISFYIGGALGSKVNVLMGKSMDPAEMTVVAGGEVAIDGWFTIANTIDIPEAGAYYFAFDCVTARGEVFVDNLYIDRGNDLGVNALTFDTATGFKKTVSKVTMSITNFGIDAQSGITIACFVNDGTSKEFIKHDEAVIDATIQPGETYYHTFDKPVDISAPGKTYTLMGEIITKVGSDTQNDKSLGQALTHYAVQEVPYRNGFEDTDRNAQWTMLTADGSNGWMISRQIGNTYDGNFILGHTSVNATAAADDWAFSECIHIPAGTYEFAMFYRTFKNMTADNYKQNFKVMLGKDATVSAMSQIIVDMKDVIVSGAVCEKYVSAITVAEEGDYYIGFYSGSPMGRGVTYLDAVSIVPVAAGRECAYEAHFADAPDEWDVYYTTMNSWTYNAADGAMVMNRNAYYAAMVGSAGWLVSPKLSFEGAQAHEVTFEYSLTGDAADSPALGIYVGAINNPLDFVLVKSFEPAEAFTEGKCVIPALEEAADRYVAIRPTMESAKKGYVAKVKSFKVAHSSTSGIENIGSEGVDAAVSEVARYDVNGRPVTAAYKGFTIVRLSDGSVRKVFVK